MRSCQPMLLIDDAGRRHELDGAPGAVSADDLHTATGWELKPEGLCRGEVCVPLLGRQVAAGPDRIDLVQWAAALQLALAVDEGGVAAFVPASAAPPTAGTPAPDVELPDLDGQPVSFSRFTGRKRVLLAWASW